MNGGVRVHACSSVSNEWRVKGEETKSDATVTQSQVAVEIRH